MASTEKELALAKMLLSGLERLSADSQWAHRASGLRGSLLKLLDQAERDGEIMNSDKARLDSLIEGGFIILENAAREISS